MALETTTKNLEQEFEWGQSQAVLADVSSLEGWIRLTGKDALNYPHKMTSNDMLALTDGGGLYNLYLTAQGKIITELWAYRESAEKCFLGVPEDGRAALVKRFTMFILNNDVEVLDFTDGYCRLTVQGPKSVEALSGLGIELPSADHAHKVVMIEGQDVRLLRRSRYKSEGFDVVLRKESYEAVSGALKAAVEAQGGGVIGLETLETLRLQAGVPRGGAELDGEVIPQEAYLETTAVSFEKGCYPGQETVAKVKYRGHVNRHLVRFEVEGEGPPESGSVVRLGEKKVGVLKSAACLPDGKVIGLGFVRRELARDPQDVTLVSDGAERAARISSLVD